MKTKTLRFGGLLHITLLVAFVGLLAAMALPTLAHAQDASGAELVAPAATSALTLTQGLSALVVPVIVFAVRKAAPAIPKLWLPVIAAALGVLGETINAFATGASANLWLGIVLGLAGVGVREASKQLKTAAAPAA